MFNHIFRWLTIICIALGVMSCVGSNTSSANPEITANDIRENATSIFLSYITTIPFLNSNKKQITYMVASNNSDTKLTLQNIYVQNSQGKLQTINNFNDFIDINASNCNILENKNSCNIIVYPKAISNYLIILSFKGDDGKQYYCQQFIVISKPEESNTGFKYFSEKIELKVTDFPQSYMAIPFVLDYDYEELEVNIDYNKLKAELICPNKTKANPIFYPKDSLCTILVKSENIKDDNIQGTYLLKIKGRPFISDSTYKPNSFQEIKEATINISLTSNNVANIVSSAQNIIINPADGATGNSVQVYFLNTGLATATNLSFYLPSPIVIDQLRPNTCGATLTANSSCSFYVNVNSGLNTSGQASITLSYYNSNSTQLISFNVIYLLPTQAPGLTLTTNSNFSNTASQGGVVYVPIIITNSGNVNFTNLQFNSINLQNSYMNYGASGTTCVTGQSLAINASCTMIIGYNPQVTQASGTVTIIPTISYIQNGNTIFYTAASLTIGYSAVTETFILVGDFGSITNSTDAITWTVRNNPPFTTNAITGNVLIQGASSAYVMGVAGNATSTVWSSLGGILWTSATSPGTTSVLGLLYVGGIYYVGGGSSTRTIMSASNLTSAWTTRFTAVAGQTVNSLFQANGAFIAPQTNNVTTSANGTTWATQTIGAGTRSFFTALYDGATYFAFGTGSGSSANGTTGWTNLTVINAAFTARKAVYNSGLYVAVGSGATNNIFTTTNPTSVAWTTRTSTSTQLNDITFAQNQYVTVGNTGTILTSSNGITWTTQISGTTANLLSVYYDGTLFWAVGTAIILYSRDAITWNRSTLTSITSNNGTYIAVGSAGDIYTSPNLTTWTLQTSGTTSDLYFVNCVRSSVCIALGSSGTILTSSNGTTWTPQTSGTTNNLRGFSCNFSNCIIVGDNGTVLTTTSFNSLNNWSAITSPTSNNLTEVTYFISQTGFSGNAYVAVGALGTIITSPDGVTWTTRISGTVNKLNAIYCPGGATIGCIAVGNNGVIYS